MARVSGWYSRWTQWVMVVTGIVLALVLNVSVVTVGKVLWEDPTLRDAVADAAPNDHGRHTAGDHVAADRNPARRAAA